MVYGDDVDLSYAVLQAEGGRGGNGGDGGSDDDTFNEDDEGTAGGGGDGGNGGRIKVFYESSIDDTSLTWSVSGGSSGTSGSGDGTPDSGYAGSPGDKNTEYSEYHHLGSEVIVTPPEYQTETVPGVHTYDFHVKNNGSADDTYDLTADSSNLDWTTSVQDTVSLKGGANETVSVDVTIPEGALDGEISDIALTASSQNGTQTDTETMRVTYDHTGSQVEINAPTNNTETDWGTHTYYFYVDNIGSADDTYDLSVDSSITDWTVNAPDTISIKTGMNKAVAVEVTVPQSAFYGDISDITLTATSQNNTALSDSNFTRVTYEPMLDVEVTAPADQTEALPGSYTYDFLIENTGEDNDTYDLDVTSSNTDWSVNAPDKVTVGVGNVKTVGVKVTIPQDALDGEFSDIDLTANSKNITDLNASDEMRAEYVHTGSDVLVTAPLDTVETSPGVHSYDFHIKNNGTADDRYDIAVNSSNPNWAVSAPSEVTVEAGGNRSVTVEVTISEGAYDGDFSDITLNALSQNGTQGDEDIMRITYEHTGSEVMVRAPGDKTQNAPGNHTYDFVVENNGTADDTYNLNVDSSDPDWAVSCPSVVSLGAGLTETVQVEVKIPQDASDGDFSDITLTASSQNGTQFTENSTRVTYGEYSLTVQDSADGTIYVEGDEVTGTEETFSYPEGQDVSLEAVPDKDFHLLHWSGDTGTIGDKLARETSIDIFGNYTITAEFAEDTYTLTLNSTSNGTVEVPGEDTFEYPVNEMVELEARADENYRFLRWAGDNGTIEDATANETTLEMLDNYSITAEFIRKNYELTIDSNKGGNVTEPGEGTFEYDAGNEVTLSAVPDAGFHFDQWSGPEGYIDDVGSAHTTVVMESDCTITAEFTEETYELITNSTEGGNVTSPGEGIFEYSSGEGVELKASPNEGYSFVRWSGENGTVANPTSSTTTVIMEGDCTLTARFSISISVQLEIISPEDGSLFNRSHISVGWDSQDAEYHEVRLKGETWIAVGMNTSKTFRDLTSGEYTVEVKCVGPLGETAEESVDFIVDLTPPEIEVVDPEDEEVLESEECIVEWQGSDELSGIEEYEIRIDSGEWKDLGTETDHTFDGLSPGNHTVEIRATDEVGNEGSKQVTFQVDKDEPSQGRSFSDTMCNLWWLLLLVAVAVLLASLLFWRSRREEPEKEETMTGMEAMGRQPRSVERTPEPDEEPAAGWEEATVKEEVEAEEGLKDTEKELEETVETMMTDLETQNVEAEVEEERPELVEEPFEGEEKSVESTPAKDIETEPEEERSEVGSDGAVSSESEREKECPRCGITMSEEDEKCPRCGFDPEKEESTEDEEKPTLDDEIFYECEECGSLITEEREDCPYCGSSIKEDLG